MSLKTDQHDFSDTAVFSAAPVGPCGTAARVRGSASLRLSRKPVKHQGRRDRLGVARDAPMLQPGWGADAGRVANSRATQSRQHGLA